MKIIATNQEERLEVCRNCPFYNAKRDKCGKCGCKMKWKTLYVNSKCPVNNWGCTDCEVK